MLVLMVLGCGGDDGVGGGGGGGVDAPIGGGGGCTATADTCTGDTLCVGNACVAAFPRVYEVRDVSVMVPTTNMGATWDISGGAPDLFVTFAVNGSVQATSPVVDDQFSAAFAGPFAITLSAAGSRLDLNVYDEDVTTNDLALGCVANPLPAADLRSRRLSCASASGSLMLAIQPR